MKTKMKPGRIASTLAMLSAAAVGIATPAAVQQPTGRSGPTVQQPTRAPAQQQGTMQTQRTNAGTSLALLDGLGGLRPQYQPFAPWGAPRYNQRKARRRARQQGRKVRRY